jgi:NhaA family Na+:H+ antiporter
MSAMNGKRTFAGSQIKLQIEINRWRKPAEGNATSKPNLGVALGLAVGKPVGLLGACVVAVRLRFATLPKQVNWNSLLGAACLAGAGFTISLFIAMLAFDTPELVATAKLAILGASLLAALSAFVVLRRFPPFPITSAQS